MQRSILTSLSTIAVASIAALALAGCGSPATEEPPTAVGSEQESSTSEKSDTTSTTGIAGEAVLSYGDTSYSASLQFCSLSGSDDALFHGPVYDSAGNDVGYLEGDFGGLSDNPHGEARIDFGATKNLQSMDEFIAMGTVAGNIVITEFSDTDLIVMGGVWDQDGTDLATATLKVTC